ncbi:MAG: CHAP domain-containing protein [Candidatus Kapaibacteriota bacterium]
MASNTTTQLGIYIVEAASDFIDKNNICKESYVNGKWKNEADCLTDLKCQFKGISTSCDSSKIGNEAYCAETVWVILDNAFSDGGYSKTILSKIKTRGAKDLLNKCKSNGIKVNTTPTAGAIFYKKPTTPNTTGHVGIVVGVLGDRIHTIEGNTSFQFEGKEFNGIWGKSYLISDISKVGLQFMHIEGYFNEPYNETLKLFLPKGVQSVIVGSGGGIGVGANLASTSTIGIILLASAGLGYYFTQNKKGIKQIQRFKKKVKLKKFKV